MKRNFFDKFYCNICDEEIKTYIVGDYNSDLLEKNRERIIDDARNSHWYNIHYNCAICGKWIPSKERMRVVEDSFGGKIHENYNPDSVIIGLLRVHKDCWKKLENN